MSTTLPESTLTELAPLSSGTVNSELTAAMEHVAEGSSATSHSASRPVEFNEFEYRPMTPLAPITMVAGVCGSIALLGLVGIAIAIAGIMTGLLALWQIRKSNGVLGGHKLTMIGMTLSFVFLFSGMVKQVHSFATEVPEGFIKLNFTHDISKKPFVYKDEGFAIAPEVQQYDDKPIFVKGYMYPTKQKEGITKFILVRDSGTCCFGGQPPVTDMILVEMEKGKAVKYRVGLIAVAGTFQTKSPAEGGDLKPVYELNATYCEVSRSAFN
ncbi:MAG: DUF3299 domain-containing protein [Planctomycetaceae bacterium]